MKLQKRRRKLRRKIFMTKLWPICRRIRLKCKISQNVRNWVFFKKQICVYEKKNLTFSESLNAGNFAVECVSSDMIQKCLFRLNCDFCWINNLKVY